MKNILLILITVVMAGCKSDTIIVWNAMDIIGMSILAVAIIGLSIFGLVAWAIDKWNSWKNNQQK